MKHKIVKLFALLLALLTVSCAVSCGGKDTDVLSYGEYSITKPMFSLMLSIQKGNMAYAIASSYGDYDSEDFWGTVIDGSSTTFNDYYTFAVYEKAKHYLSAMVLFDELKLSLPDTSVTEVDKKMKQFVTEDGEGSKKKLNELLSAYGANYDTLREYLLLEAKVSYLSNHLYGENGSKIGVAVKDNYYEENYIAFKQVLLSNFAYVYETDKNGDDIYYLDNGSTAYDTENGTAKLEGDKLVYYGADGRIAYDKENGKRSPILDKNGNPTTRKYTTDQMLDRLNLALSLKEVAESESAEMFETIRQAYSDEELGENHDPSLLNYLATNVTYQSISASYSTFDKLAKEVAALPVGGVAIVQTDAGIHLVRRYPLATGGYSDKNNSQWFTDSTYYVYDFHTNLVDSLITARLEAYESDIAENKEQLGSISLQSAVPNFTFR